MNVLESPSTQTTRIGYFDILRGIGIVLMVMGHVSFGREFYKYIHAFHMPLFFYVSGYFFDVNKYNDAKGFILNKIRTLLIPYTVFAILHQVIYCLYGQDYSIKYCALSFFSSNHNLIYISGALWFLLCLFVAEIIFYGIEHNIKKESVKIVVIVCFTLLGNFMPMSLPLCIDSALSCLAIMYVGYMVKKHNPTLFINRILNIKILPLVILFIINGMLIFINGGVNIRRNNYSIVVLFWINCISALIIYTNFSKYLDKFSNLTIRKLCKILKYFGRNSLVYLLFNEIMICIVNYIMRTFGVDGMVNGNISYYINQGIVFVICMILLTCVVEIFNRTKLKILLGKF